MKKIKTLSRFSGGLLAKGSAMIAVTTVILLVTTASVVTLAYTVGTQSAMDALDDGRNAARLVMRSAMEIAQAELYAAAKSTDSNVTFQGKCEELALGTDGNGSERMLGSDKVYYRKYQDRAPYESGTRDGKPWAACVFIAGGLSSGRSSEILGQVQAVTTIATSLNFQAKDKNIFLVTATSGVVNSALFTHIAFNRDGQGEPSLVMQGKTSLEDFGCKDQLNYSPRCSTWFTKETASSGSHFSNSVGAFMSLGAATEPFTLSGTFSHNKKFAGVGLILYPLAASTPVTHHGSYTAKDTSRISSARHEAGFSSSWQCGARTVLSDKLSPADWSNNNGSWLRASEANLLLTSIASTLSSSSAQAYELEIGNSTSTTAQRSVAMAKLSQKIATDNASPTPISQVWSAYNDALVSSSGGLPQATMPAEFLTSNVSFTVTGTISSPNMSVTIAPPQGIAIGDGVAYTNSRDRNRTAKVAGLPAGCSNPCSTVGTYTLGDFSSTSDLNSRSNISITISRTSSTLNPERFNLSLTTPASVAPREGTVIALSNTTSFGLSVLTATSKNSKEITFSANYDSPRVGDAVFGPGIPPRTVVEGINGNTLTLKFLDFDHNKRELESQAGSFRVVTRAAVVGSDNTTTKVRLSRNKAISSSTDICAGICALLRDSGSSSASLDKLYFRGPGDIEVAWDMSCLKNVDSARLIPDDGSTQTFYELTPSTWQQPI
jgi:hypothetical protein